MEGARRPILTPNPATCLERGIDPKGDGEDPSTNGRRLGARRIVDMGAARPGSTSRCRSGGRAGAAPARLDVTFTEEGDGTRVRLEHSGWADDSEDVRARYTHWDDLLARFAAHVS